MPITSVTMKIYGFEEEGNSLLVAFNSNESLKSIDEQPRVAFQPTLFEETDPEIVIKKIAQAGFSIAETQDKQEKLSNNPVAVDAYKAKVGQTITLTLDDLAALNTPAA